MNFITGGTGLVGARLIFDLLAKGEQVIALKRKNTPVDKALKQWDSYCVDPSAMANLITWVEGDLLDREDMLAVVPRGSKVYHCAAQVSFNPKDDAQITEINVNGTANLVNVCIERGVKKFCHVSSIGAIGGKVNGGAITEETPWSAANKSAYSLSKYYSEMEVWRGMAEGLNAVIVNPAVILGAGIWSQGSPELFGRVAKGMKYGTEGSTSYVYVNDVCKAMIALVDADITEQRFILSAGTLSYIQLFQKIADSLNLNRQMKVAKPKLTNVAWRFEKLRSTLTGSIPKLTKNSHRTAHQLDNYEGGKIKQFIDFEYTPLDKAIKDISTIYLSQNN